MSMAPKKKDKAAAVASSAAAAAASASASLSWPVLSRKDLVADELVANQIVIFRVRRSPAPGRGVVLTE